MKKRITVLALLILCAATLVSAQGNNFWGRGGFDRRPNPGWGAFSRPKTESVKFTGTLSIVRGSIAITGDDTTWFARGLNRFVGFIDGFKEGASVAIEGTALASPLNNKEKFLEIQKMTLNGKEYDLSQGREEGFEPYCWGPGSGYMSQGPRRGGKMRGRMMYGW